MRLSNPNMSDDAALMLDFICQQDIHKGTLSADGFAALRAAQAALDANPAFNSIHIDSDLECPGLDDALDAAPDWRTSSEELLLFRHGGLCLRIDHKHNDDATVEFQVTAPDGRPLLTPAK